MGKNIQLRFSNILIIYVMVKKITKKADTGISCLSKPSVDRKHLVVRTFSTTRMPFN